MLKLFAGLALACVVTPASACDLSELTAALAKDGATVTGSEPVTGTPVVMILATRGEDTISIFTVDGCPERGDHGQVLAHVVWGPSKMRPSAPAAPVKPVTGV